MEQTLTVVDGKASATGITKNPTVVYVYSGSGKIETVFYAARGDKIKIDAASSPWIVEGNDINDKWSIWRKNNAKVLDSYSAEKINAAVAKYVKSHSDDELSTLLLATEYDASRNEKEFLSLWHSLQPKALDKKFLLALGIDAESMPAASFGQIKGLKFIGPGDSLISINPAKARYTVLYFWSNSDRAQDDLRDLRKLLKKRADSISNSGGKAESINVVEINMQADTMGWSYRLKHDTVCPPGWLHAWAPGASANKELSPLHIPSLPFFITLDGKGNQISRSINVAIK